MITRSTKIAVIAAAAAALVLPAAGAEAASVTYVDGKNVWIASPDGAIKRQLTTDGSDSTPFHWPSADDAGTVVAFKGGNTSSKIITTVSADGTQRTDNVMPWKVGLSANIGPNSAKVNPSGSPVAYTYYRNHGPYSGYPNGGFEHRFAMVPPKAPGSPTSPMIDPDGVKWDAPTWIDGKLVVAMNGALHLETSPLQFQQFLAINPPQQPSPITSIDILRGEISRAKDRYLVHLRANTGAQDLVLYSHQGAFPGGDVTGGCWIATNGAIDRAFGLSPDGRQVTWADQGGVHVGTFDPASASGTGQCLGTVKTLSATGDEPQFGHFTLTNPAPPKQETTPPPAEVAPPPAPAPAPAPTPVPVAKTTVKRPAERAADAAAEALDVIAPTATTAKAVARGLAVKATAPGAGRLTIALKSGRRVLATGGKSAAKAAELTIPLRASKAGRKALKRLKGKRLTLAVTFAPRGGGSPVKSVQRITLT